jgi:hypothetical protein
MNNGCSYQSYQSTQQRRRRISMTKKEWDELAKKDREKYLELYKDFMYDRRNTYCCDKCPENIDEKSPAFEFRLKCGQL